jgi:putative transposase
MSFYYVVPTSINVILYITMDYTPITFQLYPTAEQLVLFNKTTGCCRLIYNQGLAHLIKCYKRGTPKTVNQLMLALPRIKLKFDWLKEIDAAALQQVLRDLDKAYQNFYRRVKQGASKVGFPRFKSKHSSKDSFRIVQRCVIDTKSSKIKVGKIGYIKARGNFQVYNNQKIQ